MRAQSLDRAGAPGRAPRQAAPSSGVEAAAVLSCLTRLNAGGATRQVVWLNQRLAARGRRTRLLFGRVQDGEDDLGSLALEAGLDAVEIPSLGRSLALGADVRALRAAAREIALFHPHIVHTHTAKAGFVGRLAAARCSRRLRSGRRPLVVHTFHGHVLSGYFSVPKQAVFRWLERQLCHRLTDAIIVLSPQQRTELVDLLGVVPADRVFVVPLGLDLDQLECRREDRRLRVELNLPDDVFVVGIVGRLAPIKDHALFLRAADALVRRRPETRFVVVGGGSLEPELRTLAGQLEIGEQVHFVGMRKNLAHVYAGLDAVALTSRQEGTPLSLIEAMAAGCPPVAVAVGGVTDILSREWSGPVEQRTFFPSARPRGLLVDSRDPHAIAAALELLITQPSRRHALAQEGRDYVRRCHGLDRLVDDVEAVYELAAGSLRTR